MFTSFGGFKNKNQYIGKILINTLSIFLENCPVKVSIKVSISKFLTLFSHLVYELFLLSNIQKPSIFPHISSLFAFISNTNLLISLYGNVSVIHCWCSCFWSKTMQLMFEFENFLIYSWEEKIMLSKACQQYFKHSQRLKIQLRLGKFKLTFHSQMTN